MSSSIFKGRYTVENDEDLVVFLIGMRINKRWALHKWLPVFWSMPGMIRELYTNKDKLGFKSTESFFGLRTTVMIQYWRSTEDVIAYARQEKHLKAWQDFNRKLKGNDAVAVYHETYEVKAGQYEAVYVNMPQYGLGKALKHIPVSKERHSASQRLKAGKSEKRSS
ncbi:transcriptional regulator [Paenibacillus montaniterrae]|uniref:Transcriptional regulator n=1 Tax=Paenibacillus montaniterrae TaxID=429341 RepID=A0A919YV49_9BACL|nr:DUF4188 domain-containing protein [Paenibacillus montaniterrae]GIP18679.1 transcriptional regulator [Paenibacillus montaniterrae]